MTAQEIEELRAKARETLTRAARNLSQTVTIEVLEAAVEFAKQMQAEREIHK